MSSRVLTFLIFLLPFVVFPIGISPFESAKLYSAEFCLLFFICLTITKQSIIKTFLDNKLFCACIGGIFLLTISTLLFQPTTTSIWGNPFRGQGIFFLWLLLGFSLVVKQKGIKFPAFLPLSLLFLQCILALTLSPSPDGRFVGTLGEANSLAGFALFLWPFSFVQKGMGLHKFGSIFLALLLVIGSGSRSGMIGFFLQLIFFASIYWFRLSFVKSTAICILLLFMSLSLPFFDRGSVYENRSAIWQVAFVSGLHSPLIGQGVGNIEESLNTSAKAMNSNLTHAYVDSSHNLLLDWWVQGGLLGELVIVLVLVLTVIILIRQKNITLFASFLGLLTIFFFNPVSSYLLVVFWWIIGSSKKDIAIST